MPPKDRRSHPVSAERGASRVAADEPSARPSLVALATAVGLIAFLAAEALPGRLSGPTGFLIGFAGAFSLIFVVMIAVAAAERQRRVHQEELALVVEALLLPRQDEALEGPRASLTQREIDHLLTRLRKGQRE